jgi:hypothetical protein
VDGVQEPDLPTPQALARALHSVFEGFVYHLPADDPDWQAYADSVLDRLKGPGDATEGGGGAQARGDDKRDSRWYQVTFPRDHYDEPREQVVTPAAFRR